MGRDAIRFDAKSARESWDAAADPYTEGQATGRDYYRFEFFNPAHAELCGDVSGLRVLDLGCGNGYFARELARRGARVTGVDIAPRMIEHARRSEVHRPLGVEYVVSDAASLEDHFGDRAFDMVTSCLALQDMPDPAGALREAARVLRPGGRLVASIAHPCTDTPFREWERDASGAKRWLCIDRYFERGPIRYHWVRWPDDFSTTAVHVTLEDWFRWFREAGLQLADLREPEPSPEALRSRPDLEDAARVPYYLLLDLRKLTP